MDMQFDHKRLTSQYFIDFIKKFDELGTATIVEEINGIRYFINEYWTSAQRQSHKLHEISYRACFKPQLPAFFIKQLTIPGDVVYDPFMGRGTTPLEAALSGRIPYGNDINPLSKALTAPRISPPTFQEVRERLASIPWADFKSFKHDELLVFYHPDTLKKIEGLRSWLLLKEHSCGLDDVDLWIRMVAINRLTGHSPGFFSVYTLPPNQAVTVTRQAVINERRNQVPPYRDVPEIILKKSRILLSDGIPLVNLYNLSSKQSHATSHIEKSSVQLVVTSPPFLDIVDYVGDNWLRCWFLDIDPKDVKISQLRTVNSWESFTHDTLTELSRIVKVGGHIAYEVGEVRNGKVKLEKHILKAAEGLPIKPLGIMINQQDFTKTSNCWGIANNTTGTNTNRIVLFERI
jgi:hypothetical protein